MGEGATNNPFCSRHTRRGRAVSIRPCTLHVRRSAAYLAVMKTTRISSFTELLETTVSKRDGRNLIYRGMASLDWHLLPSLGRTVPRRSNTKLETLEKRMVKLFKESSLPYLEHRPRTELEWLAMAQHFGLPTRLMDWTYNPLVAIYFAVEQLLGEDAVVYALSGAKTIQNPKIDPYKQRSVQRFRPPYISVRIQQQAGLFTLHPDPAAPFDHDGLSRVIIPAALIPPIKRQLFAYGINQKMIYPGLEGVAKDIRYHETKNG